MLLRGFIKSHFLLISSCLLCALVVIPAKGTVINFEAQAANRGGNLEGIPDSPLPIGIATFTGGELLNDEVGLNVDQTGVYASEGIFGSGETNPLVITFASPVSNFSVFVANDEDLRNYTVSDNLGDSVSTTLSSVAGLGAATFSLPGTEISSVTIASADTDAWSFAIDNVSFTTVAAPEPKTLLLLGSGLALLVYLRRLLRPSSTTSGFERANL